MKKPITFMGVEKLIDIDKTIYTKMLLGEDMLNRNLPSTRNKLLRVTVRFMICLADVAYDGVKVVMLTQTIPFDLYRNHYKEKRKRDRNKKRNENQIIKNI